MQICLFFGVAGWDVLLETTPPKQNTHPGHVPGGAIKRYVMKVKRVRIGANVFLGGGFKDSLFLTSPGETIQFG